MALADAVAGTVRPGQRITWTRTDGTAENLTGATLTGVLIALPAYTVRAIAGTLVLADAANGIFDWNYALADVVAGAYLVQFTATFPSGATPARTFTAAWLVHPAYAVPVP